MGCGGGHQGVGRGGGRGVGGAEARLTWAPSRKIKWLMLQLVLRVPWLPVGALSQFRRGARDCSWF